LSRISTNIQNHFWLLLLIILAGYTILEAALIPQLSLTYGEAVNLQVSRLITLGYAPYTEIFTLANPFFVGLLGWLGQFRLSPTAFKLIFALCGLLSLLSTALTSRALLGETVALATTILLAFTTTFLVDTPQVVAVTPALSLALISLLLTARYLATRKSGWLLLGGSLWGIAFFSSTTAFSISLVTILFLLFFHSDTPPYVVVKTNPHIKPVALWILSALVAAGIGMLLASPDTLINHLITPHLIIYQNSPPSLPGNFQLIGQFVTFNIWLCLLVVYSLTQIYGQADHPLWVVLMWALLSFGWLILQPALELADALILLPPLAMLAGWGLVDIGQRAIAWNRQLKPTTQQWVWYGSGLLVVILLIFIGWQQVNNFILREVDTADDLAQQAQQPEIVAFIQQHTQPGDCVLIDHAALAIYANRLPAPPLVELSPLRLGSGLMTGEMLQSTLQAYNCKAVVFSKRKYTQPLSEFKDWIESRYPNQQKFIRTTIYYSH
jgi:hypothetical protein